MARDLGIAEAWTNTGNVMLHEKLEVKYVGLKLDENEGEHRIFTVHAVQFVRETRRKYYRIVVILKEFDTIKSLDNNDEAHYDSWNLFPETYNCFRAYYDLYAEEDNVKVFEKGGVRGDTDKITQNNICPNSF